MQTLLLMRFLGLDVNYIAYCNMILFYSSCGTSILCPSASRVSGSCAPVISKIRYDEITTTFHPALAGSLMPLSQTLTTEDELNLDLAIAQAQKSLSEGGIPIGAVVCRNFFISRSSMTMAYISYL